MKIINTTPHTINVVDENMKEIETFEPSLNVRVSSSTEIIGYLCGIPLETTLFGTVDGLPEQQDGVYYIVSRLVKSACPNRSDLLCPGKQIRDVQGQVIGCMSLSI